MPLRNRNNFVIGGWKFFEPSTNWHADPNVGFNAVVAQIIAHRKANPHRFKLPDQINQEAVENELEAYTEARMRSIPGGEAYLIEGAPPAHGSFPTPPRQRRIVGEVAGHVVGEAKKVVAGVGLISSWLGSGLTPVAQDMANKRASICAGCQFNQEPNALQKLEGAAGQALHLILQAKNDMKLTTPDDDKIKVCTICNCKLAAKVWTPIEHVWSNLKPEVAAKLDAGCWQLLEKRT